MLGNCFAICESLKRHRERGAKGKNGYLRSLNSKNSTSKVNNI